jgi:hypothetical protein
MGAAFLSLRRVGSLDDARIAYPVLHAEGVAHGAGDNLELSRVLVENATSITKKATKRPIRSAKVTNHP